MVLNEEQKKQFVLTHFSETDQWVYSCKFAQTKFSREFFGDWMSFLGNMIVFDSPTKIGNVYFNNSLVFVAELQQANIMTGLAIQRLFSTILGSLINEYTGVECYLNENILVNSEKQVSITLLKPVNESIVFHVFVPLEEQNSSFAEVVFSKEKLNEFKQKAHDSFYYLIRSLFFESQQV